MDVISENRINKAQYILQAYVTRDGSQRPLNQEVIQDLIIDLFHYVASEDMNLKEILDFTCDVFEMEKTTGTIQ